MVDEENYKDAQDWWNNYVNKDDDNYKKWKKWGIGARKETTLDEKAEKEVHKHGSEIWSNPQVRKQAYDDYIANYNQRIEWAKNPNAFKYGESVRWLKENPTKLTWNDFNQDYNKIMEGYDPHNRTHLQYLVKESMISMLAKEYTDKEIEKHYKKWLQYKDQPAATKPYQNILNAAQTSLLTDILDSAIGEAYDVEDGEQISKLRDKITEYHGLSKTDAQKLLDLLSNVPNGYASIIEQKQVMDILSNLAKGKKVDMQPLLQQDVICQSGYEYVAGYYKSDGTYVKGFCRKKAR